MLILALHHPTWFQHENVSLEECVVDSNGDMVCRECGYVVLRRSEPTGNFRRGNSRNSHVRKVA